MYKDAINKYPVLSRVEEAELLSKNDINALLLSNLRIIIKIAHQYNYVKAPIEDLVQEGILGLYVAIKRFDSIKGNNLIAYSAPWIQGSIARHLARTSSVVTVKDQSISFLNKEIPIYLSNSTDIEHEVDLRNCRQAILAAGTGLTGYKKTIFEKRLFSDTPYTLAEIGAQYGVSKQYIEQMEKELKAELRTKLLPWKSLL